MGSLLTKVQAKVALYAHEKVRGALEGEYGSVFKGRSMDFDDLREYTPGDDIKDIDWKATARSGGTKIRRYVAVRKHNILLIVDSGKNMIATTESGDIKKNTAVMIAGLIGYIAQQHGDLVGMVSGDNRSSRYFPLKASSSHLETILQYIDGQPTLQSPASNLSNQLEYVAKAIRRKMFLVVIDDDSELSDRYVAVLRRLRAQHEIIWISIGDSWGIEENIHSQDIDNIAIFPEYIKNNKSLIDSLNSSRASRLSIKSRQLDRLGITNCRVTGDEDTISGIFKLLERHKNGRRR